MRQRLFFLILVFCQISRANNSDYNYGVEGGANISNFSSETASDNRNRLGIVAGIYWNFLPNRPFSCVTGGYLVGKGAKDSLGRALVLNYFQIRTLGRLSIFSSQTSKLFLDFGMSADGITQKGTQNFSPAPSVNNIRGFDASLLGGLGFETDISSTTKIAFNIKYMRGLLNVLDTDITKSYSTGVLFTTAIQFSTAAEKIVSTEERARDYINSKSPAVEQLNSPD